MSWMINEETGKIIMTRGDTPCFPVTINIRGKDGSCTPYEPLPEDRIIFAVKKSSADESCLITKEIDHEDLTVRFEEEDTKDLPFGDYIYEVSLESGNYIDTFIPNKKLKLTTEIH